MQRVIVTVHLTSQEHGVDMEVPADVAVRELVGLVVEALNGGPAPDPDGFQLEAFPPGRVLEPAETLASAGVWDGAWLLISQRNQ